MIHSAEDLVAWVRDGKPGTGMPAFGATLSDRDILAVLSYIERVQGDATAPATPAP
jgi:mono/diheme cytochrome c family protein